MSIVIRDVREHELDSVLALNNNAGEAILPLDSAKLEGFYDSAEYFRVAERDGNLAGFLVGFGSDSAHDSSNFAWFKAKIYCIQHQQPVGALHKCQQGLALRTAVHNFHIFWKIPVGVESLRQKHAKTLVAV